MSRTDTRPVRDINFPEKSGKVITRRNGSENGILLFLVIIRTRRPATVQYDHKGATEKTKGQRNSDTETEAPENLNNEA